MITAAIGFLALSAILGMILLSFVLKGKHTPKALAFTHGPLAVVGIVLLIIYCVKHNPSPVESLILFIIAATGGFILITRDLMGKTIPKWLAVVHGLVAVVGFLWLLMFRFG
jgi:hypothetical protein